MPDCCYTPIAYYEPEDTYPYLHHYYPSWCYVLLVLAILVIIYLWLRPLPPAVDTRQIARDVDAALTAYERELNSIGAGPAAIAVVEARRRALTKIP